MIPPDAAKDDRRLRLAQTLTAGKVIAPGAGLLPGSQRLHIGHKIVHANDIGATLMSL
jgi:hypothetical protein